MDSIYNFLSQKISTLINQSMSAGVHSVQFNDSKLTSYIYFYSLTSGSNNKVMKTEGLE